MAADMHSISLFCPFIHQSQIMPTFTAFQQAIRQGIPDKLPAPKPYDPVVSHAPKRVIEGVLSQEEKKLAVRNAMRYFDKKHHAVLAPEFYEELNTYGRIYMYRFRPDYEMYARPIEEYPAKCQQAAAIMLMIQNNLDPTVAKHPHELITYVEMGLYSRTGRNTCSRCSTSPK